MCEGFGEDGFGEWDVRCETCGVGFGVIGLEVNGLRFGKLGLGDSIAGFEFGSSKS